MTTTTTPSALAWSTDNCQVARALDVFGDRSSLVVIREVFNGVRRFDDMQRHSGVNRQVLSNRLAHLVDEGILRKVPYQPEGSRVRHEYRLTQKGLDLYPVLTALAEWGARYVADPEGPAVEMAHRDCGAEVHAVLVCDEGHRLDDVRDVVPRPGPGGRRL
ncbi:helix-turn-helix domain-containing protein [Nocardioides sp.]|uniref:winged helix-turn-helix transcriptional regulator n=1 Tax=Nocardioides sp. TaxID=35761 RepID=UPI0025D22093|nr:helix-turn-helix domain-containing protein [Nocardioides sp.]